ncbi:MAG: hypothetical protein H6585_05025 [Flavobacteriales bacterium]|nr:hypothetical protein [Flavobacteriales bacterium]MCB9447691.1 hypothetical protein [Flavobacteriales bacterium]
MPKKPSSDLFDLIGSLSRNEKIYFRRFAKRHADHSDNNYIRLFDQVDKLSTYDEKKMIRGGFPANQLPRTKNYLNKIILDALQQYHASNKVETILKNQLDQIQILYEKGLFLQTRKLVRKTKKLAMAYDEFPVLLEALKWEIRLYGNDLNIKRIERINTEQKKIIDKFNEFLEMETLSNIMFGIYRSEGYTRKKSVINKAKEIIRHPKLQGREQDLTSFLGKYHYNMIFGLFHYITGNFHESLKYRVRKVAIFDEQPKYIAEYFQRYWQSIFEACNIISLLYREDDFNRMKDKASRIISSQGKSITRENKMLIEYFLFTHELQFENHAGRFDTAVQIIRSKSHLANKVAHMLAKGDRINFLNQMARAYFGIGDYGLSLKWTNDILSHSDHDIPAHTRNMAIMLKILNLFELGHMDTLESTLRSSLDYFTKQKSTYKVEYALIRLFQSLLTAPPGKEQTRLLQQARDQLIQLRLEPNQFMFFHDLDITAWIDAKITQQPFAKLALEKASSLQKRA